MHEVEYTGNGQSYGISWMVEEKNGNSGQCTFDYWAALPVGESAPIPSGMRECYLPEGMYAECPVPSLQELPGAYIYVYTHWLPQQEGYTLDIRGACYELYPEDYMQTGKILLYIPILKK